MGTHSKIKTQENSPQIITLNIHNPKCVCVRVLSACVCALCVLHPQVHPWNECRMSSTFVTLAEVLEARGGPLLEEEIWSLLLGAAEALVDVSYKGKDFQIFF